VYAIAFHDVRSATDGLVRKYRVAFVDGSMFPIHLAIAPQWKAHYFSANMLDDPEHREEERAFLDDMQAVLGTAATESLRAVGVEIGLDYSGADFAVRPDGKLVVFEANAAMAIYAPGDDERWAYRYPAFDRALSAVRTMLVERATRGGYRPGAADP
jgi:hypothetical protein